MTVQGLQPVQTSMKDLTNNSVLHEVCETETYIVFKTLKFEILKHSVTTSPLHVHKFASSVLFKHS